MYAYDEWDVRKRRRKIQRQKKIHEEYCGARLFEYERKARLIHVIYLFYWHEEYKCMKFGYDDFFIYLCILIFKNLNHFEIEEKPLEWKVTSFVISN